MANQLSMSRHPALMPAATRALEHGVEQLGGLGGRLLAALEAAGAFVQDLGDGLEAVVLVGRGQEGEVQGQQARAIGSAQGVHAKTFSEAALTVIKDPGQEFDLA
jgi:hypothetical protein